MRSCLVLLLLTVTSNICAESQETLKVEDAVLRPDGSEEVTIIYSSPNVTLVNDAVYVCVSYRVTEPMALVRIEPHPVYQNHYHLFTFMCEEAGNRDFGGKDGEAWECGAAAFSQPNPPLHRGPACYSGHVPNYASFGYQYQGGPAGDDLFILPKGTGVQIGGPGESQYLVMGVHFPRKSGAADGTTAGSKLNVTLVRRRPWHQIKPVTSISVAAYSFVEPMSVGWVRGRWINSLEVQYIRFLQIYAHFHRSLTHMEVRIERPDGSSDVILDQNILLFQGITDLSDVESAIMRPGDQLTTFCTFNNTLTSNLRVWDQDACAIFAYFETFGQPDSVKFKMLVVESFDHKMSACMHDFWIPMSDREINWSGSSSFEAPLSLQDCSPPVV